jgi:hypothetical protein
MTPRKKPEDKLKVGRPTIYTPEINKKAEEYLETTGRMQTRLPKLTEFYRFIGISRQCADEWKDKYQEFGDTCKKIHELQQEELIDDGLFGGKEVNPGMAIFLLKVNHGMVETSHTDITSGGQPIPILGNSVTDVHKDDSNSKAPTAK